MATRARPEKLKTVRIPLVGVYKTRNVDGTETLGLNKDQRFLNCTFELIGDPVTGDKTIYVNKRPGWEQDALVASGNASTGLIRPLSFNATLSAFGDVNSTIYFGTTNVGTITGIARHLTETLSGSTSYVMIRSADGTGWFFAENASDTTAYTGDTHTNTTIDNVSPNTTGMYIGQEISGSGIVAGTRIASVDSSSQITVDTATTATAVGVAITKTPIAKITDADFVTTADSISGFAEMNGFLYYTDPNAGRIWNSDLNSVTSWPSDGFLAANMAPDPPIALARHRDKIIVFGGSSKESFADVGNATGSPLQRWPQDFEGIGIVDQRSLKAFEDALFWVSAPKYGDVGVYKWDGVKSKKVSTPVVDRILGTLASTDATTYTSVFRLGGYAYLGLSLSLASEVANDLLLESGDFLLLETGDNVLLDGDSSSVSSFSRMLIYNVDLDHWSEWDGTKSTFIDGSVIDTGNRLVASSRFETDGKIYKQDATNPVYQDDGTDYTMEIRTSKVDFNTQKRKFIHKIRLVSDVQASGTLDISWSDDDYATFSTTRSFDLTKINPTISMCGSHVDGRIYKLQHTSNNPFRAEALEITYSEGTR